MARQGLFANTMGTEAAQRRAELAKERQAYLEGNIYSDPLVNIAAQAQRGMRQAFRDIGQGAATSMLGDQAYVDPILKDALKRDKDRKELLDMFANADTDGDGNVSEAEYKVVANAMKARGYPIEAEKVLEEMRKDVQLGLTKKADERAQEKADREKEKADYEIGLRGINEDTLKANLEKVKATTKKLNAEAAAEGQGEWKPGREVEVRDPKTGNRWVMTSLVNSKLNQTKPVYTKINPSAPDAPPEGVDLERVLMSGKTLTQETKQVSDAEKAKEWVGIRTNIAKSMGQSREALRVSKQALELLDDIENTGGAQLIKKGITDFFGVTEANIGQFQNLMGTRIVQMIGEFGSNPTEGERKFAEGISAGLAQGKKVNEAILTDLVKVMNNKIQREQRMLRQGSYDAYMNELGEEAIELSQETKEWLKKRGVADNKKQSSGANKPAVNWNDIGKGQEGGSN